MPLAYRQVKDLYDALEESGAVTSDMATWAGEMNRLTKSDIYSEGENDNWLRRASVGLDRLLEATGVPDLLGDIGAGVGDLVGNAEAGRTIGKGALRSVVDFAPLLVPGAGAAVKLGGTALLSGVRGYADTGSPAAGVVSGLTAAAMPGIANVAEQSLLKRLGVEALSGPLTTPAGIQQFSRYLPQTVGQGVASFGAGQVAGGVASEAANALQAGLDPNTEYEFSPSRAALEMTLGQVPFAGVHAVTKALGGSGGEGFGGAQTRALEQSLRKNIADTTQRLAERQAADALASQQPIEKIPVLPQVEQVDLTAAADTERRLNEIMGKAVTAKAEATELSMEEFNRQAKEYEAEFASRYDLLKSKPLEFPVQPDVQPDAPLFKPEEYLQSAWNDLDAAKTLVEFHAAAGKVNVVRQRYGQPALTQEHIDALATERGLTPKAVVQSEINKTERRVEAAAKATTKAERLLEKRALSETRANESNVARALVSETGAEIPVATENLGTFNGKPIVRLPDNDPDTDPVLQIFEEVVSGEMQAAGELAFQQWQKTASGLEKTSLPIEQQRYLSYVRLREQGKIGRDATLSPSDANKLKAVWTVEGLAPENDLMVTTFPARNHVRAWDVITMPAWKENLDLFRGVPAPQQPKPAMPAGGGFVWGMTEYDPATNRMGKHTIPKTGMLRVSQFKNMAGKDKPLPDVEIELAKTLVPEAFDEAGNVNVKVLMEGLKTRGPVVEVKKLGDNKQSPIISRLQQQADQIQHELDTRFPDWYDRNYQQATGPERSLRNELAEVQSQLQETNQRSSDASRYSFLGPKTEQDMPGYVEGLVRVPSGSQPTKPGEQSIFKPELYRGPHFGSEDTNVLAFFRGYEETLPDGRKAFHVIEVQSDWGQRQRDEFQSSKDYIPHVEKELAEHLAIPVERRSKGVQGDDHWQRREVYLKEQLSKLQGLKPADIEGGHPLLRVYETIALKSAIQHARSIGAEAIVVSDAETAMMTEGHDKQQFRAPEGYVEGTPFTEQQQIPQSGGMRLHYDQTLPSAMKKLTGEEGQKWEGGVHKGALNEHGQITPQAGATQLELIDQRNAGTITEAEYAQRVAALREGNVVQSKVVGSPVFRNSDDTPKSSITGRVYDLARISGIADQQGGLTVSDPARSGAVPKYVPKSPEQATKIAEMGLDRGGVGLAEFVLSKATNPLHAELAQALVTNFPEQLKRSVVVIKPDGLPSAAYLNPNSRLGNISLEASLLAAPDATLHQVALHELVHQVSQAELDNPTKANIRQDLDNLRLRMRDGLNAEQREALSVAERNDWYGRYGRGEADFNELHPDLRQANLLYAMLDLREFVSQGFTDSVTRQFMQSQKGKKLGLWEKFKGYVKTLLGIGEKVPGTAFDEFLSHSNALMQQGEYVADFYNFAERKLEGMGLTRGMASVQAQRALGLVHEANQFQVTSEDLLRTLDSNVTTRGPQFQRATNKLDQSIAARDEDYASWVSLAPELGQPATRAGLDEFVQDVLRGEANVDSLEVLPDVASRYVFEKLHNMREVLDTLKAGVSEKNQGLLNLTDPKSLRKPVSDALKAVDKLLDSERMLDQAITMIQGLNAITPAGYFEKFNAAAPEWERGATAPEVVSAFLGEPGDVKKDPGVFRRLGARLSRFLKPVAQYDDPRIREGFSYGFQMPANSKKMETEATKFYGLDFNTGEISKDSVDRNSKALGDDKIGRAANKWIWENQKAGGDKVGLLGVDDPRVQQHLKNLTADERLKVEDLVSRHQYANQMTNKQVLEKMEQVAVIDGAGILNRINDLKHEQNVTLTRTLWNAIRADFNDPVAAQKAQGEIASVQQRLEPQTFNGLLAFLQNQQQVFQVQKDFFDANPNWSSAQRQGAFRVKFFDRQGKVQVHGAMNRKDAEAQATAAGGKIAEFWKVTKPGDEDMPVLGSDRDAIAVRLNELLEQNLEIRRNLGQSAEELELTRKLSEANQWARETAGRGLSFPTAPPRGLTRGAENVPYISNQFSYIRKVSDYWTRRLFRSQMDAFIAQKELPPEMKQDLKTHKENILQSDPESVQALNNFTRTWFMGFNPANVIINAVQPFTTHVSELTSLTGKPLDSYRRVLSSLRELGGRFLPKWLGASKEWGNPELARLEKDALAAGEIGLSQFDNDAAVREATAVKFKTAADGNRPKSFGQYMSGLMSGFSRAGMWMFQHGEQLNNRLAINTAFKLFREQGKTYEQARDAAFDFNHRVNFAGGKASRPVGLFSGRSPVLRGTAMLATSMQSYVLGTTFQIIRYLKNGLYRPTGLTPHEVFSARKAGIQMLATQLAAAGVLGLPFVSGAIALLDKAFPEAEVNKNLRETVRAFFQEDEESGGVMTDMSMTGLPSMLGWDLQSRLSMGNTLPGVSEVNGFQPENLLGPPVNLISNFVRGGAKVLQGDSGGARSFVPSALKKLTDLVSSNGELRDYRDRPIATDVTPGEKLGMVLGFNPKRLSDFNAASRMAELTERNEHRETGQFNQQMAEEVLKGNFGTVRQTLLAKSTVDKTYDPVTAVRAIVRVAEELSFPRDLRREGTSTARSRLMSSFNLDPSRPSEVTRLQFRQKLLAQFGLPDSDLRGTQLAQLMDQLKAQNPAASRSELRRQAELALRRARVPMLME